MVIKGRTKGIQTVVEEVASTMADGEEWKNLDKELSKLEDDDSELLKGLEDTGGQRLGVAVQEWIILDNQRAQAKFRRQIARNIKDKDEVKKFQEQLERVLQKEIMVTRTVLNVLVDEPDVRAEINNWLVMPPNLRKLLHLRLRALKIDVNDVVDVVDRRVEEERQRRLNYRDSDDIEE